MEKESNEALSKQKFANKSLYATQQPPCSQKQCCHNCKFLIELFKHPFNKIYNGAISESTALFVFGLCVRFCLAESSILSTNVNGKTCTKPVLVAAVFSR